MFLHLSVILFRGGVYHTPPLGRQPPGEATLPAQCMLGYGQQAGGTHPTGMHSCYVNSFRHSNNVYDNFVSSIK